MQYRETTNSIKSRKVNSENSKDKITGAHFNYYDMCLKLSKLLWNSQENDLEIPNENPKSIFFRALKKFDLEIMNTANCISHDSDSTSKSNFNNVKNNDILHNKRDFLVKRKHYFI